MKRLLVITAFVVTALTAVAQSNLEYIQTDSRATSRLRPNLFYSIGSVQGFSLCEFYVDSLGAYFDETFLTRSIVGALGIEAHALMDNTRDYSLHKTMIAIIKNTVTYGIKCITCSDREREAHLR